MPFLSVVLMLLPPVLFYGLIFSALWLAGFRFKNVTKNQILISTIVFLMMILFVFLMVRQNRFIYYWDYGREWRTAIGVKNHFLQDVFSALKTVYRSINHEDYNQLMPMLAVFFLYAIGDSFNACVVLVEFFYMIPAVLVTAYTARKILNRLELNNPGDISVLVIIAATPILHYVMLDGFMDPPVLILVALSILTALDLECEKVDIKRSILLAAILTLLVLFRRHFAYYAVGFIFSQFVLFVLRLGLEKNRDKKKLFISYVGNMLIIGALALLILSVFFRPFLMRSIFNNFSLAYKAYDATLTDKLYRIPEVFGIIVLIFAFIAPVIPVLKNKAAGLIVFPLIANIVVTTVLLWRVLQMNYHQYYLIVIQVMLLAIIGYAYFDKIFFRHRRRTSAGVVIVFAVWNFSCMFFPAFWTIPNWLFTTKHYEPKIRNDLAEIHNIVADIQNIVREDGGADFYTLSSSGILNYSVLASSEYPHDTNPLPTMYSTHDVDLRDGFPASLLQAEYVLVGDPVQTHLPEGTQYVITEPAEQILNNTGMGSYFSLLKEYHLDKGVKAKLYKKTKSLDREIYAELRDFYDALYPDLPELFHDRLAYPKAFFPSSAGEKLEIKFADRNLYSQFESDTATVRSTGSGYLIYGPYKRMEKGVYDIVFKMDNALEGSEIVGTVDLCVEQKVIASKEFVAGENSVLLEDVVLDFTSDEAELRIYVNTQGIGFEGLEISYVGNTK